MRAAGRILGIGLTAAAGIGLVVAPAFACSDLPQLKALSTTGPPGGEVVLTVTGFPQQGIEGPIEIRWNTREGPALAAIVGRASSIRVTVPSSSPGLYIVNASQRRLSDQAVIASHSTPFRVVTGPVTPPPPSGEPAATISPGGPPPAGAPATSGGPTGGAGSAPAPAPAAGARPNQPAPAVRAPASGTASLGAPGAAGAGDAPSGRPAGAPQTQPAPASAEPAASTAPLSEPDAGPMPVADGLWSGVSAAPSSLLDPQAPAGPARPSTGRLGFGLVTAGAIGLAGVALALGRRRPAPARTSRR